MEFRDPTDRPDEEYPLHCNNGRVLEHFHEGNMTMRSAGLVDRVPDNYVEMSRRTAEQQGGLRSGDWVTLTSPRGELTARVLLSEEVRDGELYVPITSNTAVVNDLTSNAVDPDSSTPAYKELKVKLRRSDHAGRGPAPSRRGSDRSRYGGPPKEPSGSPLPAHHHRYGNPTPQRGVEVERKWSRGDYIPVGDGQEPRS